MKKKLFTIAIALCMVFTMIPVGVFQIETAWADTNAPTTVKIGGVEMVGSTNLPTYYKNNGTIASTEEIDGYDAMYNPTTATLTLDGLNYNGIERGIFADGDLKIVLNGTNIINTTNVDTGATGGIYAQGNLTIEGSNRYSDSLTVTNAKGYGISAVTANQSEGSVTIRNATIKINSQSSSYDSIFARKEVTIINTTIDATTKYRGMVSFSGEINISQNSHVILHKDPSRTTANCFSHAPKIQEVYQYRTDETGTWTSVAASGKITDTVNKESYLEIRIGHTHCACGVIHKSVGNHEQGEAIEFATVLKMDNEQLMAGTTEVSSASKAVGGGPVANYYVLPEGSYYLDDNLTLTKSIYIEGDVQLCLNGYNITCTTGENEWDKRTHIVTVASGGNFTLTDCNTGSAPGKITHESEKYGSGVYNYGTFNMYGGMITANNGSGVYNYTPRNASTAAVVNMYGGMISDNSSSYGAGIHNDSSSGNTDATRATVNLYGGTITENRGGYRGGGISNSSGGEVNMSGSTVISGNQVTGDGGGVYNCEATFNMTGGIIGGANNSGNGADDDGGGVFNWGGIFNMDGGSITGNSAGGGGGVYNYPYKSKAIFNMQGTASITKNSATYGGGVYSSKKSADEQNPAIDCEFNISGSTTIKDNTDNNGNANNVYLKAGEFLTADSSLYGSARIGITTPTSNTNETLVKNSTNTDVFSSDMSGYKLVDDGESGLKLAVDDTPTPPATEHKHYLCGTTHTEVGDHTNDSEVAFTAWDKTNSLPTEAGNYYLTEDVTLTTAVEYPGGFSGEAYCGWDVPDGVVLCLNGKNITMKNPDDVTKDVDVIKVTEHFTLTDCKNGDAQGKITHAINSSNDKYKGKGVKVLGGTFDMYGGIITENTSNYSVGGSGVSIEGVSDTTKASVFRMYGGKISGNTATSGGGVHIRRVVQYGSSEFRMYGGSITNNTADSDAASYGVGGGVYVSWTSKFVMNGGTISENTATQFGGGVYASALAKSNAYSYGGAAELDISGQAMITDNKAGNEKDNLYLDSHTADNNYDTVSAKIAITEPLTGTIGVTTKDLPTAGNPVVIAAGAKTDKDYNSNIKSDKSDYEIGHASNPTELILKVAGDPDPTPVTAPTISEQPKDLEITYGKTGNFTVKATAATDTTYKPLQYQWYKNTTNSNTGGTKIEGATSATYSIPSGITVGEYYYYCEVTAERKDNGQKATATTNAATLTVSKAPVTVTVNNQNAYINGTLPANSYKAEGLVNGDKFDETSVKYEYKNAKDETVTPNLEQAGTYKIEILGLTLANADNYDVAYKPGTLTITQKSSGGSGSSTRNEVITTGTTDSKVTSSPTEVKNETKTDANGNSVTIATVTVSSANQREILNQAKANKSGEIIIKVSQNDVKDDAKLELSLDKSFIESIVNDTDAKLTIQTPSGEKTFTQEELKKLAAEATGITVTIDPTSAGTTEPTTPTEPTNPSADKNAKLVKGVENTTIVLKSKLTKDGNVLLTWTKSKGYKVDKFEIYRSVKRSSGYGKAAFFTTKDGNWSKYLNTKNLKAGKTYYYKVRGVRTIDGQKYYTQWSNKAWRTIK